MARPCLSSARTAGVVLVVLAVALCDAEHSQPTCAEFGQCCEGNNIICGPSCKCDEGCVSREDCCSDYEEYCGECEVGFVRIADKCTSYIGEFNYIKAKKICRRRSSKATILMPETEKEWNDTVQSEYFEVKSGGDSTFTFWLNCRWFRSNWYWSVPGVLFPGVPVTWNKFPSETARKKSRLVATGVGSSNPWSWSKPRRVRHTFCQRLVLDEF